jgi:hypothetical protein
VKYRAYEHAGKVLDRIDTTDGDEFGVPDDVARSEVANALGVADEAITVVVADKPPTPKATIPAPDEKDAPVTLVLTQEEISILKRIAAS